MPLTVIPAQAGIQYGQGQAEAIKAGSLDAGFRRYDDDNPANPCKCNFHFGFSLVERDQTNSVSLAFRANVPLTKLGREPCPAPTIRLQTSRP